MAVSIRARNQPLRDGYRATDDITMTWLAFGESVFPSANGEERRRRPL